MKSKQNLVFSRNETFEGLDSNKENAQHIFKSESYVLRYKINIEIAKESGLMPVYRLANPVLLYVHSGRCETLIDNELVHVSAGTVVFVKANTPIQHRYTGESLVVSCFLFDELILTPLQNTPQYLRAYQHYNFQSTMLDGKQMEAIEQYIDFIWQHSQFNLSDKREMNYLLLSLISFAGKLGFSTSALPLGGKKRSDMIFSHFLKLVNQYSSSERGLDFYSDKLNITKKYLCYIVKTTTDSTAKEWIDRSVVKAAKEMLSKTDLQVAEIADKLKFSHTATFCKLFKRVTDVTPIEYRNKYYTLPVS